MKTQLGLLFTLLLFSNFQAKGLLLSEITHLKNQLKDTIDLKTGKLKERKLAVVSMNRLDNGVSSKSRSSPRVDRYLKPTKPRYLVDEKPVIAPAESRLPIKPVVVENNGKAPVKQQKKDDSAVKNVKTEARKLPKIFAKQNMAQQRIAKSKIAKKKSKFIKKSKRAVKGKKSLKKGKIGLKAKKTKKAKKSKLAKKSKKLHKVKKASKAKKALKTKHLLKAKKALKSKKALQTKKASHRFALKGKAFLKTNLKINHKVLSKNTTTTKVFSHKNINKSTVLSKNKSTRHLQSGLNDSDNKLLDQITKKVQALKEKEPKVTDGKSVTTPAQPAQQNSKTVNKERNLLDLPSQNEFYSDMLDEYSKF